MAKSGGELTEEQVEERIAKWREIQSAIALKLVDLDEAPTYQAIRGKLYRGTTAYAIEQLGDTIGRMWTLSGLLHDAITEITELEEQPHRRWARDRWLSSLAAHLHNPVIAVPDANIGFTDALQAPTLTLGAAFTQLCDCYDRVIGLVRQIDSRVSAVDQKVAEMGKIADRMGAAQIQAAISQIGDEMKADPLGVSLDSFSAIEAELNQYQGETMARQSVVDAINLGERRIKELPRQLAAARQSCARCQAAAGFCRPVPESDARDLLDWGETLRTKLADTDLAAIHVGLAKWQEAIERRFRAVQEADQANRDLLNRLQEVQGRFSAAQAKAMTLRRSPDRVDVVAGQIRAGLAAAQKNVLQLEELLQTYERLVFG